MNPLAVGPKNCEDAVGVPWRWLREHAEVLGIAPVKIDGKTVFLASSVLRALEARAPEVGTQDVEQDDVEDEVAAMRRRIAAAG